MSQYWELLADRTGGLNTADEFEAAAYRLVTEQVLYYRDRHSRLHYGLAERFEQHFRQALAPLGVDLNVNRQLRYACATPRHEKFSTATVAQTLLALVLRNIYDESANGGHLDDDGEVQCDLVELGEKYRLATQRDLPGKGELDALLGVLKRWGIARKSFEDAPAEGDDGLGGQPYVITIRPAIIDILGEAALRRLALWAASGDPTEESETQEESPE